MQTLIHEVPIALPYTGHRIVYRAIKDMSFSGWLIQDALAAHI
jgi:hypothetical protein